MRSDEFREHMESARAIVDSMLGSYPRWRAANFENFGRRMRAKLDDAERAAAAPALNDPGVVCRRCSANVNDAPADPPKYGIFLSAYSWSDSRALRSESLEKLGGSVYHTSLDDAYAESVERQAEVSRTYGRNARLDFRILRYDPGDGSWHGLDGLTQSRLDALRGGG